MYFYNTGPRNDPPTDLQEKVLTLIQSWSDAFQQYPELQGVTQVYQELKSKGIEFPMTNMDLMAPIITPQKVTNLKPFESLSHYFILNINLDVQSCRKSS